MHHTLLTLLSHYIKGNKSLAFGKFSKKKVLMKTTEQKFTYLNKQHRDDLCNMSSPGHLL